MFQKRTSKRTRKSRERMLELRVSSPRIVMFEWLRYSGKVLKLAVMMLVVGALGFVGKGAWDRLFLYNTDEFGLKSVPLTTFDGKPTTYLTDTRVEAVTGLSVTGDKTIFQFDVDLIEEQLRELPEIAAADVTRRLPDSFEIKVKEREPVAWIACPALGLKERSEEAGLMLDSEGVPFSCRTKSLWECGKELPVIYAGELPVEAVKEGEEITHEGLVQALELVEGLVEHFGASNPVEWVMLKDEIILEAKLIDGTRATFSYYDQERQLENLVKLVEHAQSTDRQIASINLIPYRLVPVKYR